MQIRKADYNTDLWDNPKEKSKAFNQYPCDAEISSENGEKVYTKLSPLETKMWKVSWEHP